MKMDKEELERVEKKLEQLKNQRQAILNHQRKQEQKQRTRRLIQNGALAEKYLNCEGITPEDFEKVLLELVKDRGTEAPASSAAAVTNRESTK